MSFFFTLLFVVILYVRPQEFWDLIQGWPIMDYVAGGAILFVFLSGEFQKSKLVDSPIPKMLAMFWVWLALTQVGHGWLGGFPYTIQKFGRVAILFYLIVLTVDSIRKVRILIWTMIILSTFLSIEAIVQFYTGISLGGASALARRVGEDVVMQARGIGIFSDPNDLALHVVPMLAFLVPPFHKKSISNTFITGVIFMIPLVTGVVYTRSRGGILAMAFVAWIYMRHRVGMTFSVVGLVMLFGLLMAVPRFDDVSASSGSAQTRLDHWAYGLSEFRANPLFGMGYDNFTTQGYRHTAHNSFVLVLAESGLIGTILWLSFFYSAGRHIFAMERITRGPPWVAPMSKALEAALGGWMVGAFFLSQSYGFLLYILLAIIVAIVNILNKQGIDIGFQWKGRQTRNVFFITVGMVVGIHILVRTLFVVSF
ncbi:MAG: O-antigen ligase family protein [Desulfarculaceae bacterium]|nr:O-antigen ligase family protein [Desulfarculaceae bacterium]